MAWPAQGRPSAYAPGWIRISASADAPGPPAPPDWAHMADGHGARARGRKPVMIEARGLTKRFGDKLAVDQLTFTVEPGRITGFLGPNGAGKTTTMRLILGLDRPTRGTVSVHGKQFSHLAYPMHEIGALLDAKAVH